jgi:hypothetical protein
MNDEGAPEFMVIGALEAAIASDDPLRITPMLSTIRSDVDQNVIDLRLHQDG